MNFANNQHLTFKQLLTYEPLRNLIIALPIQADEISQGGILIPEQARKTLNEATIVLCGPDVDETIRPGETIVFTQHSETRVRIDGETYIMVEQENVLLKKTIATSQT